MPTGAFDLEFQEIAGIFTPEFLLRPSGASADVKGIRLMSADENYKKYAQYYNMSIEGSVCIEDVDSSMGFNSRSILDVVGTSKPSYRALIASHIHEKWQQLLPSGFNGTAHGLHIRILNHAIALFAHRIPVSQELKQIQDEHMPQIFRFLQTYKIGAIPIGWDGLLESGTIIAYEVKNLLPKN